MTVTELDEIRRYWSKKYPNVLVTLYANEDCTKYFGKMMGCEANEDLTADTIGDLISQGEAFLRKLK